MNKHIIITLIFLLNGVSSFACLNTYQFKIFPIDIHKDTILTVDIQIHRISETEGRQWLGLDLDSAQNWNEMFFITGFVSKYDKNQRLLDKEKVGVTYSIGKSYSDSLQSIYTKGFNKINTQYSGLTLFKPVYLSFCDYQQSCELLKISNDSITNKGHLIYAKKKYLVQIIQDTSYYAFDKNLHYFHSILDICVSSIRIYKAGEFELIISHLATGHEIALGWITNDIEVFKEREAINQMAILAKEYKPEIDFSDIQSAIYEEPLLHHGYGFDIFICKE